MFDPDVYGTQIHAHLDDAAMRAAVAARMADIDAKCAKAPGLVIPGRHCMNVGTGVESVALVELGARHVDLFNYSASELARFRRVFADHPAADRITPHVLDIVDRPLPRARYGAAYVNGVVHHSQNVRAAVANCVQSLESGGALYLSVYRRDGFRWFVACMMRRLRFMSNRAIADYAAGLVAQGVPQTLGLIFCDDLLCNHMWLYSYEEYEKLFDELGARFVLFRGPGHLPHRPLQLPNFLVFVVHAPEDRREIDPDQGPCSPASEPDQLDPAYHRIYEGRDLALAFRDSPLHRLTDTEAMLEKLLELSLLTPLAVSSAAGWDKRNALLADVLATERPVHKDILMRAYARALEGGSKYALR